MEQRLRKFVRPRRTVDQIRGLLDVFDASGLSAAAFCDANNICKGTFYKWLSRYNKSVHSDNSAGFASLNITNAGSTTPAGLFAEVCGIKFYQPVPASYLIEFLVS